MSRQAEIAVEVEVKTQLVMRELLFLSEETLEIDLSTLIFSNGLCVGPASCIKTLIRNLVGTVGLG